MEPVIEQEDGNECANGNNQRDRQCSLEQLVEVHGALLAQDEFDGVQ
jgi:hypothetical protein